MAIISGVLIEISSVVSLLVKPFKIYLSNKAIKAAV